MSAPAPYTAYERPEFFELQWLAPSVLGVAFHRPPVNAFHVAMWTEMHRIFQRIKIDGDVRVVVLSGNGRCFTAGLDCRYDHSRSSDGCGAARCHEPQRPGACSAGPT